MTRIEARCLMAMEITHISSCIRPVREPEPGLTILEPDEQEYQQVVLDRWGDRRVPKH